jgi:hypothetical protein
MLSAISKPPSTWRFDSINVTPGRTGREASDHAAAVQRRPGLHDRRVGPGIALAKCGWRGTRSRFGFLIAAIAAQLVLDGLSAAGVIGPVEH